MISPICRAAIAGPAPRRSRRSRGTRTGAAAHVDISRRARSRRRAIPVLPRSLPPSAVPRLVDERAALPRDRQPVAEGRELRAGRRGRGSASEAGARDAVAAVEARAVDECAVGGRHAELRELGRDRLRCRPRWCPCLRTCTPISAVSSSAVRLSLDARTSRDDARAAAATSPRDLDRVAGRRRRASIAPTVDATRLEQRARAARRVDAGSSTGTVRLVDPAEPAVHGERAERADLTVGAVVGRANRQVAQRRRSGSRRRRCRRGCAARPRRRSRRRATRATSSACPASSGSPATQAPALGRREDRIAAADEAQPLDRPVVRRGRCDDPRRRSVESGRGRERRRGGEQLLRRRAAISGVSPSCVRERRGRRRVTTKQASPPGDRRVERGLQPLRADRVDDGCGHPAHGDQSGVVAPGRLRRRTGRRHRRCAARDEPAHSRRAATSSTPTATRARGRGHAGLAAAR